MSIGKRIKERLDEIGQDVKWLSRKSGLARSTLYDLMRGDQEGTTKLASIARALGLRSLWLETGRGPRLVDDPDDPAEKVASELDLSYGRETAREILLMLDDLTPSQRDRIIADLREEYERNVEVVQHSGGKLRHTITTPIRGGSEDRPLQPTTPKRRKKQQ